MRSVLRFDGFTIKSFAMRSQDRSRSSSAPAGLASDCFPVDLFDVWYTSVNFAAGESLVSLDWRAQIDCEEGSYLRLIDFCMTQF